MLNSEQLLSVYVPLELQVRDVEFIFGMLCNWNPESPEDIKCKSRILGRIHVCYMNSLFNVRFSD